MRPRSAAVLVVAVAAAVAIVDNVTVPIATVVTIAATAAPV